MADWKTLTAKLAAMGLPVLGKAIGTLIAGEVPIFGDMVEGAGENIGSAAAAMLAEALGVPATPAAIDNAIETQPTTAVVTALQAKEAEAASKWPALAQIAQAEEETARTQITSTADVMKTEILAGSQIAEGKWRTIIQVLNGIWRPSFAIELLIECAFFFFGVTTVLLWALFSNKTFVIDAMVRMVPLATVLLLPYMGARFGLLGYHMNLRTREKEAVTDAVTGPQKPITLDDVKSFLKLSGIKIK